MREIQGERLCRWLLSSVVKMLAALRIEEAGWRGKLTGGGVLGSNAWFGCGIRCNCVGVYLCTCLWSQGVAVWAFIEGPIVMVLAYVLLELVWTFTEVVSSRLDVVSSPSEVGLIKVVHAEGGLRRNLVVSALEDLAEGWMRNQVVHVWKPELV